MPLSQCLSSSSPVRALGSAAGKSSINMHIMRCDSPHQAEPFSGLIILSRAHPETLTGFVRISFKDAAGYWLRKTGGGRGAWEPWMVPIPQREGGMRSVPVCGLLVPVPSRGLQVGVQRSPRGSRMGQSGERLFIGVCSDRGMVLN